MEMMNLANKEWYILVKQLFLKKCVCGRLLERGVYIGEQGFTKLTNQFSLQSVGKGNQCPFYLFLRSSSLGRVKIRQRDQPNCNAVATNSSGDLVRMAPKLRQGDRAFVPQWRPVTDCSHPPGWEWQQYSIIFSTVGRFPTVKKSKKSLMQMKISDIYRKIIKKQEEN